VHNATHASYNFIPKASWQVRCISLAIVNARTRVVEMNHMDTARASGTLSASTIDVISGVKKMTL
jgi:hypothetical protein